MFTKIKMYFLTYCIIEKSWRTKSVKYEFTHEGV